MHTFILRIYICGIQLQEQRYHISGIAVPVYWNSGAILAGIFNSTTESVRLYGTPVSIGGKTPNMLTVRSGRQTVSCRGLAVPGARNTHAVRKNDTGTKKQNYKNQPTRKQITPNQTTPHSSLQKSKTSSKPHQTTLPSIKI